MGLRHINADSIKKAAYKASVRANTVLRPDVLVAIKELCIREKDGTVSKSMMEVLVENADIAQREELAICQDTGVVAVFLEMGEGVVIDDGNVIKAVEDGVREAYEEKCFRKSVVGDPLLRENTGTNTPCVVHIELVQGDKVTVSIMPKGFGSENKSRMVMLNPTAGADKVVEFCVETVRIAGADACPPYVLGVGIGGTMEECPLLAKKALLRPIDQSSCKPHIAELERIIKMKIDELGIGVMGLGGVSTVMGVNIETGPTHIAGLPVAVNLSCHALRSAKEVV